MAHSSGDASQGFTLSLPELSQASHVPMPVILRLVREHPEDLPSWARGGVRYFRPEVVPTVVALYEDELRRGDDTPVRGHSSRTRRPTSLHDSSPRPAGLPSHSKRPAAVAEPDRGEASSTVTISGRPTPALARHETIEAEEADRRAHAVARVLARSTPRKEAARRPHSPQGDPEAESPPPARHADLSRRLQRLVTRQERLVRDLHAAIREFRRPARGEAFEI